MNLWIDADAATDIIYVMGTIPSKRVRRYKRMCIALILGPEGVPDEASVSALPASASARWAGPPSPGMRVLRL